MDLQSSVVVDETQLAGHYQLGVALARLGHLPSATLASEIEVSMLPGLVPGHRWLAAIHSRPGGDPVEASVPEPLFFRQIAVLWPAASPSLPP